MGQQTRCCCKIEIDKLNVILCFPAGFTRNTALRDGEIVLFNKIRDGVHLMRNDSWGS